MWKGRHIDPYQPDLSTRSPYCWKQARVYSLLALKVTKPPYWLLLETSRPSGSWLAAMSTRPLRGKRPPSDTRLNTPAKSSRPVGGKASPSSGQSSPVPLATAAISIAALVPAVKELYIFGLKSPLATSSSVQPKKPQTVSGVD